MDSDWVDVFPIKNGDIPASYVSLPEGSWQIDSGFPTFKSPAFAYMILEVVELAHLLWMPFQWKISAVFVRSRCVWKVGLGIKKENKKNSKNLTKILLYITYIYIHTL